MNKYANKSLLLQSWFLTTSRFHLKSNREIEINIDSFGSNNTLKFPLEQVLPSPLLYKKTSITWIVTFVVMLLITAMSISASDGSINIKLSFYLSLFTFLCFLQIFNKSYHLLVFTHVNSGHEIFTIPISKANKQDIDLFVEELISRIKSFRNYENITIEERVDNYLRYITYLFDDKVLSDNEYVSAKQRALDMLKSKVKLSIVH